MTHVFKMAIIALMILVMPLMSRADNTLAVKNNTSEEIKVAIVWYRHGNQYWESKGWYKIAPYTKISLPLHDFDLGSNTMYVGAISGEKNMNGQSVFRVDYSIAFDIIYADKFDNTMSTAKFLPVVVHNGETLFNVEELH